MRFKDGFSKILSKVSFLRKKFTGHDDKQKLRIRATAVLLGIIISITVGVGVGIYILGSRSQLVKFWSKIVPFPAGLVRWQLITYAEYLKDLIALEHFYTRQQKVTGLPSPDVNILPSAVMNRLVRNIALLRLSRDKKISVSREELTEQFQKTGAQVGGEEDALSLLQDLYGWNKETFMDRVLYYFLLEEKLSAFYGNERELNEALTSEIEKLKETRFFGK